MTDNIYNELYNFTLLSDHSNPTAIQVDCRNYPSCSFIPIRKRMPRSKLGENNRSLLVNRATPPVPKKLLKRGT